MVGWERVVRSEDRVTYATAVWSSFQAKAKTKRDMSSAEYHYVSKWMDRNIPLPVVLRAIYEFNGTPRRLEACVDGVDRAYEYWRQALGALP
jgi:hypothetical protein